MSSSPNTTTAPYADPLYLTRSHSPHFSPSHRRLQRLTREYVSTHITPNCSLWESAGHVPRSAIALHARLGYMAVSIYPLAVAEIKSLGMKLPADIPVEEWDGFHDLIVIDEIARCGYLGVIWALSCGNSIGAPPVVNFGSQEQRRKWLPGVLRGEKRFCLGVTEPDGEFSRVFFSL